MKINLWVLGGVALSMMAVTVPVIAQPQPGEQGASLPPPPEGGEPGGPGGGPPGVPSGANEGNNSQRQEFRQKMLERFDTNHDGQLDDNERAQMHQFMEQRRKMREQEGGMPGGPQGNAPGPNGGPPGQGFGPQGGGGPNSAQWQAHHQKMLEKFDTNHDGQLDDNERAQMRQFMQQRRMMREEQGGPPESRMPEGGPSGFQSGQDQQVPQYMPKSNN